MQVYKRMEIGTAKPSSALLARIPHHLISLLEPSDQYNAGEFVKMAEALVPQIRARGRFPVICGGTAFYMKSFLCGLPQSPPGSAEIRGKLRALEMEKGRGALYEELIKRDQEAAGRIKPNDGHRILRALEILESTGKSVFSFHWPRSPRQDFDFMLIGLERPREALYRRIDERVERMFESGLVDEIRRLIMLGYGPHDPGMQGIGYREFFQMQTGCITISDVKDLIKRNTRRFAKRQLTFFRSIPGVKWMGLDDPTAIRSVIEAFIGQYLRERS